MKLTTDCIYIFLFFTFGPLLSAQSIDLTSITGKIVDAVSAEPVPFASVIINNSTTNETVIGTTTDFDGVFELSADCADCYLEISFIGYTTQRIDDVDWTQDVIALGAVNMVTDAKVLEEVVVRAEKSTTEFKLDKRVFNVGQDLSNSGAGALDVLNNVPSVNVNIEGEVSLRGSTGVQILINGKPSVIATEQGNALGTITADMIDKIEVITNPSAKYDAEGTSGIINIVIKKEERKGLNGSVTLNTGTPENHSFGLSLNRRTEKFNLFSQFGVGYREMPNDRTNINTNLLSGVTIASEGREFRNETFYNFVLGTDYHIDDNNVITLSGNLAYEIEDQPSLTSFSQTDASDNVISSWERTEVTEATNPKYQYELQYKREFTDDEDHTLLFSLIGNLFSKDQSSTFFDRTIEGEDVDTDQKTATSFSEERTTFKLDYTKPINKWWTLETGAQYMFNHVNNDFEVADLVDNIWEVSEGLTNVFDYNQNVLALYGTAAFEKNDWGIKVGLRAENTELTTLLENTQQANSQNFTDLFPSIHSSYKFSEGFSMQTGYSRRIFRPRMWNLNPFFNIRNNFNIRQGNPDLLPEYTDSYELTSIFITGKTSMNLGVFYRYTTDVVERIVTSEENVNTSQPFNIGTNKAMGVEFNAKYTPNKKLTLNADFNYNRFRREGGFDDFMIDFTGNQWTSKMALKVKLPFDIDIEATGRYSSSVETVQGEVSDLAWMDMGLRKKILNGRGILNIAVRDLFRSRIRESITDQTDFYAFSRGLRGRFVTVGFSYGFGKGEAMEFSGRRRR